MNSSSGFDTVRETLTGFFRRSKGADAPPRLTNPVRFPFGEFQCRVEAVPGTVVEIQRSRDLKTWEGFESVTVGKDPATLADKGDADLHSQFYRGMVANKASNIIGFAIRELPSGYAMISNPLHGGNNSISAILPSVPEGTVMNKFNVMTFQLSKNEFIGGRWSNPLETLTPGDGALLLNPAETEISLKFVGEVVTTGAVSIHQGMSMRSSVLPIAGRLDTGLGFPIAEGDVVSMYSSNQEKYLEHKFENGQWTPEPPFVRLCEAFWIAKNASAIWTQKLPEV